MFDQKETIQFTSSQRPILIVVIDTEEEFNWREHFDRSKTSINAIKHIHRVQDIFDKYKIKPTYVSDYPIVTQDAGIKVLKEIQDSNRGVVGAHLHTWVNPPHKEEVTRHSSYPGNLSYELEHEKLKILTETIQENFGRHPAIYKAGRYGIGKNSAKILEDLDYEIDTSVCPPYNYNYDNDGPDFSHFAPEPYWFGNNRKLLELPLTGAFVGFLQTIAAPVYEFIRRPILLPLRIPGVLARINALDRLRLSPEGFNEREHIKLTRELFKSGVRTFSWTFHSPSVVPGITPYVRTNGDLDRFLDSFRKYFDYFFGEINGISMTPLELKTMLEAK